MAQFEPAAPPAFTRSTCVDPTDFLGQYEDCHHILGQGSFGRVSLYRCRCTNRPLAIKAQTLRASRDMTEWLREESALKAAVQSPAPDAHCVVRLFASCLCPFNGHSIGYLVMEHCGMSLAQALQQGVGKPLSETLRWTCNLFCGLSFIHSCRIVHRDIKPDNILLAETSSGEWDLKIADFGLSQGETSMMTATGAVTSPYLAPEMLLGLATLQASRLNHEAAQQRPAQHRQFCNSADRCSWPSNCCVQEPS